MHLPLPSFVLKVFSKVMGNQTLPKNIQGFILGSFSAFLPCGWLYSFVLGALATQSPIKGAAFLGLFWLGTVPALVLAPSLIRKVLAPISQKAPKISGAVLIAAGLITVGLKLRIANPTPIQTTPTTESPTCH
jgi:sulfite exporter TauE/SafE